LLLSGKNSCFDKINDGIKNHISPGSKKKRRRVIVLCKQIEGNVTRGQGGASKRKGGKGRSVGGAEAFQYKIASEGRQVNYEGGKVCARAKNG